MEFDKVVLERLSIRKFTDASVEDEKVLKLLEAARLCQSAKNRQPWLFMVLRDTEKNAVAQIMLDLFEQQDVELPGYANSSKSSANIIKASSVLILVFREFEENWNTGDLLSIGAAIEHICLKAVDLGLGSVWIRDTVYTEKQICEYVGYPQLQLVSAVAVGYPNESPSPRPRKELNELLIAKK